MEGYLLLSYLLALMTFITQSFCIPLRHQKTLVLLDNMAFIETHSLFFDMLKGIVSYLYHISIAHNHTLNFELYSNKIALTKYGSHLYDNLIFMVPSGARKPVKQPYLPFKNFLEFFDTPEKNIMIVADPAVFPFTRKLANEFGVDFDPQGAAVTDGNSLEVLSSQLLLEDDALFSKTKGIVYQGVGLHMDPKNPYTFPILKGDESSFSVNEKGGVVNEAPVLVAGYQGLNNNRVTITGSTMMCSNIQVARTATKAVPSSSPNYVFCEELIEWNFGESGVLRASNILHKKVDNTEIMPTEYSIKTDIEYRIDLSQWDKKSGRWAAFDDADAQLEFVMLDPYYRIPLSQLQKGKPTYSATLKTPDRLGVFQFKVNYTRKGYTSLSTATKASVRQIHFDEMPRFMPAAVPYYVSVFITMVGFFVFVTKLMLSKDEKKFKGKTE